MGIKNKMTSKDNENNALKELFNDIF